MALQARAEATRQRILDSAVDLFAESGYGQTGLADVLQRAGVSKGAFYYHFDSKESVAVAIIEDYCRRNRAAVEETIDDGAPLLEKIISATFASAAMLESDKTARVGNQLLQALGQVSSVATKLYSQWTAEFTANLTTAFESVGTREDINPGEMAKATWAGVLGCHLLSSALDDDPYARLARAWRAMLRATVPSERVQYYDDLLDCTARELQDA